ncbi:MAG: hypothetical protein ACUVV6_03925 [Thermoplasmatota archaeon]
MKECVALLQRAGLALEGVIDTHTHADHISGGPALTDMGVCDYMMFGGAPAPCRGNGLYDGEGRTISGIPRRLLHTPGHTADSMCIVIREVPGDDGGEAGGGGGGSASILLTGDTLLSCGPGARASGR